MLTALRKRCLLIAKTVSKGLFSPRPGYRLSPAERTHYVNDDVEGRFGMAAAELAEFEVGIEDTRSRDSENGSRPEGGCSNDAGSDGSSSEPAGLGSSAMAGSAIRSRPR